VNGGLARSDSPGKNRGGGPGEETLKRPSCGGQRPQLGPRFQGGVISIARRSAHPKRCAGRVPRAVKGDGSIRRVPVGGGRFRPWKRSLFHEEAEESVLAALGCRGCAARKGGVASGVRRRAPPGKSREATEASEVRSHRGRGKKIPTPRRNGFRPDYAPLSIHRSGLGGVKPPFPPDQIAQLPSAVR